MKAMRGMPLGGLVLLGALGAASVARGHESPVDHIERSLRFRIVEQKLHLRYETQLPLRLALLRMRRIDANGDGALGDEERASFLRRRAARLAHGLRLKIGGERRFFRPLGPGRLAPPYRERFTFVADLGDLPPGRHEGVLRDRTSRVRPGPYTLERPETPKEEGPRVRVSEAPRLEKIGRHKAHAAMIVLRLKLVLPEE
jgi:hypothetical protein